MLHNHWHIKVKTQKTDSPDHFRVVGFVVDSRSYKYMEDITANYTEWKQPLFLDDLRNTTDEKIYVNYTYSIMTIDDETTLWENRLEHRLMSFGNKRRHASSIILNFAIIAVLCSLLYGMIKRGVNKDFEEWIKDKVSRQQRRQ